MITDRSHESDAAFQAELARIEAAEVALESAATVEKVARAIADTLDHKDREWYFESYADLYRRYAVAAITVLADRNDGRGQR